MVQEKGRLALLQAFLGNGSDRNLATKFWSEKTLTDFLAFHPKEMAAPCGQIEESHAVHFNWLKCTLTLMPMSIMNMKTLYFWKIRQNSICFLQMASVLQMCIVLIKINPFIVLYTAFICICFIWGRISRSVRKRGLKIDFCICMHIFTCPQPPRKYLGHSNLIFWLARVDQLKTFTQDKTNAKYCPLQVICTGFLLPSVMVEHSQMQKKYWKYK